MKKVTTMLMALILFPVLALAAMLNGTVVKVDKDKKEIVVKTDNVYRVRSTIIAQSATRLALVIVGEGSAIL